MQIRIVGTELPGRDCGAGDNFPGYTNIHVGVQAKRPRDEIVGLLPADVPSATWVLECSAAAEGDIRGPQIQGPPGDRFIYLSWGTVDDDGHFTMFRRAKLMLAHVPTAVLAAAASGTLVGSLGLTDAKGHPLCARVVPPAIRWSSQ